MYDGSDTEEFCSIPPEIVEVANSTTLNLLPEKSRKQYEIVYNRFKDWCSKKDEKQVTESLLLEYFSEKSKNLKPSTLWSVYSMVKASLASKDNIDIRSYSKLTAFLKRESSGYRPEKSKIFSREEIYKFLSKSPDENYLMMKVVLIFGIAGACSRDELRKMTIDDVEDHGTVLIIKIPQTESNKERSFVVSGKIEEIDLVQIIRKYASMRAPHTEHKQFFVYYANGKCSVQVVGINTFGKIPSKIAKYLGLENPSHYNGHCFRRSSATLLAHTRADILNLNRHGSWKSSAPQNYGEKSFENVIHTTNQISSAERRRESQHSILQNHNIVGFTPSDLNYENNTNNQIVGINFTADEEKLLLEFVKNNANILENKSIDSKIISARNEKWVELSYLFASNGFHRDWLHLRNYYQSAKSRARQNIFNYQHGILGTLMFDSPTKFDWAIYNICPEDFPFEKREEDSNHQANLLTSTIVVKEEDPDPLDQSESSNISAPEKCSESFEERVPSSDSSDVTAPPIVSEPYVIVSTSSEKRPRKKQKLSLMNEEFVRAQIDFLERKNQREQELHETKLRIEQEQHESKMRLEQLKIRNEELLEQKLKLEIEKFKK